MMTTTQEKLRLKPIQFNSVYLHVSFSYVKFIELTKNIQKYQEKKEIKNLQY